MLFEKGNHFGEASRFSRENQPTTEARRQGQQERWVAKRVARELLFGKVTDAKALSTIKALFPHETRPCRYHEIIARLYVMAMQGNLNAIEKVLRVSGDITTQVQVTDEEGNETPLKIEVISDKAASDADKLING